MRYAVKDDHGIVIAEFKWKVHAELFIAAEQSTTGNGYFLYKKGPHQ